MLSAPLTDKCPNDAVEISRDGQTIFFFWSPTVGGTYEELLHIHTGTYFASRMRDVLFLCRQFHLIALVFLGQTHEMGFCTYLTNIQQSNYIGLYDCFVEIIY